MPTYKPYSLKKMDDGRFFVIPKDYRGIDFILPLVNEELHARRFVGQVVFDLLLSNGNNSRRFFNSFFDGIKIEQKSLVKIFPAPEAYIRITNHFIKAHPNILTKGILRSKDVTQFKILLNISE